MELEPVIVTLHGSDTARCEEFELEVTRRQHGIIDVMARLLVEADCDPERPMRVTRQGTKVFDRDRPVSKWAAIRLLENDKKGFQKTPYRPFNGIK